MSFLVRAAPTRKVGNRHRRARPAGALFGNQNGIRSVHPRHHPARPGGAMFVGCRFDLKYRPRGTSPPVAVISSGAPSLALRVSGCGVLVTKPALRRGKLAGGECAVVALRGRPEKIFRILAAGGCQCQYVQYTIIQIAAELHGVCASSAGQGRCDLFQCGCKRENSSAEEIDKSCAPTGKRIIKSGETNASPSRGRRVPPVMN